MFKCLALPEDERIKLPPDNRTISDDSIKIYWGGLGVIGLAVAGLIYYYGYRKGQIKFSFICPHCLKQVNAHELTFNCPFCEKQYQASQQNMYDMFLKCRNEGCNSEIQYIQCPHADCQQPINLMAYYNEKELRAKRYD